MSALMIAQDSKYHYTAQLTVYSIKWSELLASLANSQYAFGKNLEYVLCMQLRHLYALQINTSGYVIYLDIIAIRTAKAKKTSPHRLMSGSILMPLAD